MAKFNLTLANDTFTYTIADARDLIVNGRGGDDTITTTANSGNNVINTLDGNDIITTGAGDDRINAGNGNNTINAGHGDNVVKTGAPGGGTAGVPGDTAGTGDDTITTLGGNDIINAGNGDNTVTTGAGIDIVKTGVGSDMITTGVGQDTVTAGAGNDTVAGGTGNDIVDAGDGDDTVAAGAGNDTLNGKGGNDTLNGGADNDTLSGGAGNDLLSGGTGNDKLIYDAADSSVRGGSGTDTLLIAGSGVTLDLTLIANGVLVDIEVINLRGSGDNTLTLAVTDVLAISTTDTLRVTGDAGDVVNAGNGWAHGADQVIGANTYDSYTRGNATLLVDSDIAQNIFA